MPEAFPSLEGDSPHIFDPAEQFEAPVGEIPDQIQPIETGRAALSLLQGGGTSSPETLARAEVPPIEIADIRDFLDARNLSFGDMNSYEYGRVLYGPVLASFVAERTPPTDAQFSVSVSEIIEKLRSQSVVRQNRPESWAVIKRACISKARKQRSNYPIIETALELSKTLSDYDAFDIAQDVVAALGVITNHDIIDLNN